MGKVRDNYPVGWRHSERNRANIASACRAAALKKAARGPPYSDGTPRTPGITERADGWFVVRWGAPRRYIGAFRDSASARAVLKAMK